MSKALKSNLLRATALPAAFLLAMPAHAQEADAADAAVEDDGGLGVYVGWIEEPRVIGLEGRFNF